jgi:signal transduction histidine kinase
LRDDARPEPNAAKAPAGQHAAKAGIEPAALLKARGMLEALPHPAGLWTPGRETAIFNAAAQALFGLADIEVVPGALWMRRVYAQDRADFRRATERLYGGSLQERIEYRFLPAEQSEPISITELTSLCHRGDDFLESWSIYALGPSVAVNGDRARLRELLLGLNHEVSNNLQAIKGEVALLKIAEKISEQTAGAVNQGVANIKKLLMELGEYLMPAPLELNLENPALVFAEVLRESETQLREHHIKITFVLQEPLPALPLGRQFRKALAEVIQFSCALLPQGGEVNVETALLSTERGRELEIRVINASRTELGTEELDVFRPFLNINGRRIGLSMAVAREILRRHSGKIVFCREHRNRAVFSIRMQMPAAGDPASDG